MSSCIDTALRTQAPLSVSSGLFVCKLHKVRVSWDFWLVYYFLQGVIAVGTIF